MYARCGRYNKGWGGRRQHILEIQVPGRAGGGGGGSVGWGGVGWGCCGRCGARVVCGGWGQAGAGRGNGLGVGAVGCVCRGTDRKAGTATHESCTDENPVPLVPAELPGQGQCPGCGWAQVWGVGLNCVSVWVWAGVSGCPWAGVCCRSVHVPTHVHKRFGHSAWRLTENKEPNKVRRGEVPYLFLFSFSFHLGEGVGEGGVGWVGWCVGVVWQGGLVCLGGRTLSGPSNAQAG